ncbi:MAG: YihY/virulence factor BrkB family protein [Anaerolineaceae bacterium]|nr:YihY/virulence factor BrkB family protein [Anaerolineaceae bacterium]
MFKKWTRRTNQNVRKVYRKLNHTSNGAIEILVNCFESFTEQRVSQTAASLGYYAFFSIFPLLLVMIIVASYFVDQVEVHKIIIEWVTEFIPFASGFIEENIHFIFENNNIAGIIALIGLVWSSTTVFYTLVYNINLAWSPSKARQPIKNRIVALMMIAVMMALMVLSTTFNTMVEIINNFLPFLSLFQTPFWNSFRTILPFGIRFMAYFSLYKWVPDVKVRFRSAFFVSLLAMATLEFSSRGFRWMLQNGLVRYQVVYGTLGTIMTIMFWIYINFLVILFYAHLTAAIETHLNNRSRGRKNLSIPTYHHPIKGNHE